MLVGFKPIRKDQLVSFSALTLLAWSFETKKPVPDMTYNVFGETLNLPVSLSIPAILYLSHPLTSIHIFTQIFLEELKRGSQIQRFCTVETVQDIASATINN